MVTEEEVYEALKDCYDPEIPINVVDLGLVYGVVVEESKVKIDLTLTSIGCPLAAELVAQIQQRAQEIEGVDEAVVNLVWSPPWTPQFATDDGKMQLAMMGIPI
ncbi:MAG: metal-sulfur cluster assembly factor [Armatimonadetes bacterium]|nr:metal-sulfur cluster assembly factor [Armatimonadota bacterium]